MSDIPFPKNIRLAAEEYRDQSRLFHLVMRAWPGTRPFRGVLADSTWEALLGERERASIELIAACLMPDHLHVLARPAERSIVEWVNSFKSYTTWTARKRCGAARVWQPSFWDRVIRPGEYEDTLAYVLGNPVAARLVECLEDWPHSWWRQEE